MHRHLSKHITPFYHPFCHLIVPLFSVTMPRILPFSAVLYLHRCIPFWQFSSSLSVNILFCSRTHVIYHVYGITSTTVPPFYHPFYLSFTTPFYQPVLPMPLFHAGHHNDLHINHGHPCHVLRHCIFVTHSLLCWMIRLPATPVLSRYSHSPEHTRNMFIQPTANESIILTLAWHLLQLPPHPRYFMCNTNCAMHRYSCPLTRLDDMHHSIRFTTNKTRNIINPSLTHPFFIFLLHLSPTHHTTPIHRTLALNIASTWPQTLTRTDLAVKL